jgi:hypothetical protein
MAENTKKVLLNCAYSMEYNKTRKKHRTENGRKRKKLCGIEV